MSYDAQETAHNNRQQTNQSLARCVLQGNKPPRFCLRVVRVIRPGAC
jgi:hypothetical protein